MRFALGIVAAVLVGLALFEVTMQPSAADRSELAIIFLVLAGLTGLAGWVMPSIVARSRRLVVSLFVLSLASVGIAIVGVVVVANRMFFSDHDLTLLLVVLGFGMLASLAFAVSASTALSDDLERMAATAHEVAQGNLTARTGVARADELGSLATDLDTMADRLEQAAAERDADDGRRRQFFAAVGHDLRSPLASMQAAVEALSDGVAPDPDRYLRSLESDVAALHVLVDDLFLLSRLEAGDVSLRRSSTDLTDVADEAIEVLNPLAARKDIDLVLEAEGTVVVESTPEALARVIRNLLDNAVRHAPRDSTVRVVIETEDSVVVAVVDEGPGFAEDFVGVAFDSFSREDSSRSRGTGGAGLGLAIARGLVEGLGGEIWAESGPGGRVAFRLT